MNEGYRKIIEILGKDRVIFNEPLSDHTTFRIGGPADLFYQAETEEEMVAAIKIARETQAPYLVLGEGSKLLVGDKGFRGIVINFQFSIFNFQKEADGKFKVTVGAGMRTGELLRKLAESSLSGLGFMAGIPGTVGGAVRGNAGAWQQQIGDKVSRVKILNSQNQIEWIAQESCSFSYRDSCFKHNNDVVLEVELILEKADSREIEKNIGDIIEKRKLQPKGYSAGCVFVNPKPQAAGALIEECGLKGCKVGGAKISNDHANFIINTGEAKAADVIALVGQIKTKVKDKFGIDLQEEIVRIGEF